MDVISGLDDSLPPGPYMIQSSTAEVFAVYRSFQDTHHAFLRPGLTGPGTGTHDLRETVMLPRHLETLADQTGFVWHNSTLQAILQPDMFETTCWRKLDVFRVPASH